MATPTNPNDFGANPYGSGTREELQRNPRTVLISTPTPGTAPSSAPSFERGTPSAPGRSSTEYLRKVGVYR